MNLIKKQTKKKYNVVELLKQKMNTVKTIKELYEKLYDQCINSFLSLEKVIDIYTIIEKKDKLLTTTKNALALINCGIKENNIEGINTTIYDYSAYKTRLVKLQAIKQAISAKNLDYTTKNKFFKFVYFWKKRKKTDKISNLTQFINKEITKLLDLLNKLENKMSDFNKTTLITI